MCIEIRNTTTTMANDTQQTIRKKPQHQTAVCGAPAHSARALHTHKHVRTARHTRADFAVYNMEAGGSCTAHHPPFCLLPSSPTWLLGSQVLWKVTSSLCHGQFGPSSEGFIWTASRTSPAVTRHSVFSHCRVVTTRSSSFPPALPALLMLLLVMVVVVCFLVTDGLGASGLASKPACVLRLGLA
jgi:hypothetical protein